MSLFRKTSGAFGLGVVAALLLTAPIGLGQEAGTGQEKKMVFEEQDTMAATLKRLEGRTARLRLEGSGEEVVGKIQKVGKDLAHLSDLSGREFFDAVVRIDQVSAVAVQVRGR